MALTIAEVSALQKELEEKFGVKLHLHDACGGQAFSLEKGGEEVKEYILAYFSTRKEKIIFAKDGLHFTVLGR
jgi:ribosomal protein L7/L12